MTPPQEHFVKPDFQALAATDSDRKFDLRNKLFALMILDEHHDALIVAERLVFGFGGTSSMEYLLLGMLKWFLNEDPDAPYADWLRGNQAQYQDLAGGMDVWLVWHLHAKVFGPDQRMKESTRELRRIGKSGKGKVFPGVLANVVLGNFSGDLPYSPSSIIQRREEVSSLIAKLAQAAEIDFPNVSQLLDGMVYDGYLLAEYHYMRLCCQRVMAGGPR
ncbi:hypothetical protein [Brevifollis gellanilyticus]|uniref:Uncharacterized protein n=1 Tax=Brevifollis gellanilyticus TaxID=748831 RepID=A0A512M9T7_9BACT|nr:hypothetical protein [Brevifollis gellanilyticus]GEP43495.1 hypothetical protein BGE01nite_27860 [Brevifollis gellanilyticus]